MLETMFYYGLCFVGSCLGAAAGIFAKYYDRRAGNIRNSTSVFNLILAVIATLYFLIFGIITTGGFSLHKEVLGYILLRAVGYVLGTYGYMEAIHRGSMLITIVVSSMGSLIPIVYAVAFFGEPATVPMIIGAVILFVALYLFHRGSGNESGTKNQRGFWLYVIMSGVGNGVTMLALKIQQHEQPDLYREELMYGSMFLVAVVFAVMLIIRRPVVENAPAEAAAQKSCRIPVLAGAIWAVLYAVSNSTVNYISTLTVTKLPAIVFYMINTGFGIVLSFLTTRFIIREKLEKTQYIGFALSAVGLILLSLPV